VKEGASKREGELKHRDSTPEAEQGFPAQHETRMGPSDRLSNERYRAFIENISDGVYETDLHGNFTYFNNSLCRIFGYPREEIQWQNYSRFMDQDHARKAYDAFRSSPKTEKRGS
jgi:PAS domain-containing protein